MTTTDYGAEGLALCISVALLWLAHVVYRKACMEAYRQDLFIVRNRLWDYAFKAGLLDSPAHRQLRLVINGFIRMAPVTNLVLLGPFVLGAKSEASEEVPMEKLFDQLPDEAAKTAFRDVYYEVAILVTKYIFLQTFPGCLLGWPVLAFLCLRFLMHRCKGYFSRTEDQFATKVVAQPAFVRVEFNARKCGRHHELIPTG